MTLLPPSGGPSNRRPHQLGRLHGTRKTGAAGSVVVEWLIDSGSDVAVVQARVGAVFDTKVTGATASPTTGGAGILMVRGLEVEIQVDSGSGTYPVRVNTDVGIKSSDAGSNIVGVAELQAAGATLVWASRLQAGTLVDDRAVSPDGRQGWSYDPLLLQDAKALLGDIRRAQPGGGSIPDDPEDALHAIVARYRNEVSALLTGLVGYREARAIMSAGIDAWNDHLRPAKNVSASRRAEFADDFSEATAGLLADCARLGDHPLGPEIRKLLEIHAAEIRRTNS